MHDDNSDEADNSEVCIDEDDHEEEEEEEDDNEEGDDEEDDEKEDNLEEEHEDCVEDCQENMQEGARTMAIRRARPKSIRKMRRRRRIYQFKRIERKVNQATNVKEVMRMQRLRMATKEVNKGGPIDADESCPHKSLERWIPELSLLKTDQESLSPSG